MCVAAAAFAQEKKTVAVYVTGNCDENIKKVVSSRIIAQIVRSRDYAAVERTLDFDEALRREQNYQHSGNVDDGQVIKLGKQFGAGLVCVADANKRERYSEYLFTIRLINIETGLIICFSSISVVRCTRDDCDKKEYCVYVPGGVSSGGKAYAGYVDDKRFANGEIKQEYIITMTNNLTTELLQNVTTTTGKQKLAVYVTNSSNVFKAKTVSSRLTENFTNSGAYAVVDRTSDFRGELNRQQSGRVDDGQLVRLGRQFGVNQVCVVDILNSDYTTVRIINVETGIIVATAEAKSWNIEAADGITKELMTQLLGCTGKDKQLPSGFGECCEGLVNVNGVCRDVSGNITYWIDKSRLGFEVMYKPIIVKAEDVVLKNGNVCPSGWRMPTETELVRMVEIKEELGNFLSPMITSDFTMDKRMYNKKKYDIYHYYKGWKDGKYSGVSKFCLFTVSYDKKYDKKKEKKKYDYGEFYVKCVRD
jgi:hypothetical protein